MTLRETRNAAGISLEAMALWLGVPLIELEKSEAEDRVTIRTARALCGGLPSQSVARRSWVLLCTQV